MVLLRSTSFGAARKGSGLVSTRVFLSSLGGRSLLISLARAENPSRSYFLSQNAYS